MIIYFLDVPISEARATPINFILKAILIAKKNVIISG